jgi:hypothetical protein
MTTTELLQFYAPLVGLLGLAFWTGVLSQRVKSADARIKSLEEVNSARVDLKPELASLNATVGALKEAMGELKKDTHEQFAELSHIIRNRLMAPVKAP